MDGDPDRSWPIEIDGIEPIRELGSGGFGNVWLARQPGLDRFVAVKIGHVPLATVDAQRRFERECRALGRLSDHPHIVDVHSSGVSRGLPYLVLEYIDGGSLEGRGAQLGEAGLRPILAQLCDAMATAHVTGVLHRDLKPENVLLRSSGEAVLADFGIARLHDSEVTSAPGVTASLAYVAPELLDGSPPNEVADVYGLGITIVSSILGRSPFVHAGTTSVEAIVAAVARGVTSSPIDAANLGISPGFAALLAAAMDRDPTVRPPSMVDLGDRLAGLPPIGTGASESATVAAARPVSPSPGSQPPTPVSPSLGSVAGSRSPAVRSGLSRSLLVGSLVGAVLAAITIGVLIAFAGDDTPPRESATDPPANATPADPDGSGVDLVGPDDPAGAEPDPPSGPLALPLTGAVISELTPIPRDPAGLDQLLTPADLPQYCGDRPDVTGLIDTIVAVYPGEPTVDGGIRQVAQRLHRFSTPAEASAFIASYTTIACDSWEDPEIVSDGVAIATAELVAPTIAAGDEIAQVDQVTTLPGDIDLHARTVLVRRGTDVFKLFYSTIDAAELQPIGDRLTERAVEILGY